MRIVDSSLLPLWIGLLLLCGDPLGPALAQVPSPNYKESRVPNYTLPPLLRTAEDDSVVTSTDWWTMRRPQLLNLFREHVYGELPPPPPATRIEEHSVDENALNGAATRRQVTLHFTDRADGPALDLLVYLPNTNGGPVPVFAGLNFAGNHTIEADTTIRLPNTWVPEWSDVPSDNGTALEAARGARDRRWPVAKIIGRGYGLITAYYGDLFPDRKDGFQESVYQLGAESPDRPPLEDRGSALSAWAWGLHRMMDYSARTGEIDSSRVIAMGHSRLGKAALWATATDRRFAGIIDNASGAGGSALFRRRYGERALHLYRSFPHWFTEKFRQYRENESELPIDQHQLLALSAPRPLLISPKSKDRWADPRGMFLSARRASRVWRLLGHDALDVETMPPPGTPILSRVGFYLRRGEHDLLPADWSVFLDFADKHVTD